MIKATSRIYFDFIHFLRHGGYFLFYLNVCFSCLSVSSVKMEAKSLIKRLFSSIQRCENETDWKHLQDAANGTAAQEDR